jgi:release factor glutamine methyltransferase
MDILDGEINNALPKLDIIISNPPYIPKKDSETMSNNVLLFEPAIALFVEDNNPLLFYNAIAVFGNNWLKKNGTIYLEIHEDLATDVMALFKQKAYSQTILRKDLQGKDRMIKVVK